MRNSNPGSARVVVTAARDARGNLNIDPAPGVANDVPANASGFQGLLGALLEVDPTGLAGKHRKAKVD